MYQNEKQNSKCDGFGTVAAFDLLPSRFKPILGLGSALGFGFGSALGESSLISTNSSGEALARKSCQVALGGWALVAPLFLQKAAAVPFGAT